MERLPDEDDLFDAAGMVDDLVGPDELADRLDALNLPDEDDLFHSLGSTSEVLHALVLQAIQLEVASTFGQDGPLVVSALTGQAGESGAAQELERALAQWLGSEAGEPGWRHLAPGPVSDSPQAQDTPPARAKSLREFLNSEHGR